MKEYQIMLYKSDKPIEILQNHRRIHQKNCEITENLSIRSNLQKKNHQCAYEQVGYRENHEYEYTYGAKKKKKKKTFQPLKSVRCNKRERKGEEGRNVIRTMVFLRSGVIIWNRR